MVVFTCNHCGDSLRKPAVEKHYSFVCRKVKSLTCVDCLKDFREEEYVVHTKCLTEEERYAAKGSMPNGVVKKGELKQESWVDMIKSILEEAKLTSSQKNLLSTISTYDNIPRKKPKFLNFIKSSSGGRVNMKDVEDVWNIIESYKIKKANNQLDSNKRKGTEDVLNGNNNSDQPKNKKQRKEQTEMETNAINDSNKESDNSNLDLHQSKKKKKKNKPEDQEKTSIEAQKEKNNAKEENVSTEDLQTENFSFQTEIIRILEKKINISLKKLQKKTINAYLKHSGEVEVTSKIIKKFNKGLKKISNVEIVDDYISLKAN